MVNAQTKFRRKEWDAKKIHSDFEILTDHLIPARRRDLVIVLKKITDRRIDIVLYIDLRPSKTCHSKVMHRKEVTHFDGSYEKKSRRWTWLTVWDKVKSHGTGIDWYTGREWPVNCMTVISAWWRSNMLFQRLSGRLNYYITRWSQWVEDQMS